MIEHNYPLYIVIWLAVSLVTLLLFKTIPKKMKTAEDMQTRSSLFTILIFIGVPLAMIAILGTMVFIVGDKGMDSIYKLIWGVLVFAFIVYFAVKQISPKK